MPFIKAVSDSSAKCRPWVWITIGKCGVWINNSFSPWLIRRVLVIHIFIVYVLVHSSPYILERKGYTKQKRHLPIISPLFWDRGVNNNGFTYTESAFETTQRMPCRRLIVAACEKLWRLAWGRVSEGRERGEECMASGRRITQDTVLPSHLSFPQLWYTYRVWVRSFALSDRIEGCVDHSRVASSSGSSPMSNEYLQHCVWVFVFILKAFPATQVC